MLDPTLIDMGKPTGESKKAAGGKKKAPLLSALDAADAAAAKKQKRKSQQARAGLEISVPRCRRAIGGRWKGKVSADSAVALAATLQFIHTLIITGAAESAAQGIATDAENVHQRRISSADVQAGVFRNTWLRRDLVKGRVIGAAPATAAAAATAASSKE